MEAGVEHFGRGVETSVDAVLIVVEPSFESLELAGRVKDLAAGSGITNIRAVLNKIPEGDIAAKLEAELSERGIPVVGCIHNDADIFRSGMEGGVIDKGKATLEIKDILDSVLALET
jgi:CO dehydrogenase maturation factor